MAGRSLLIALMLWGVAATAFAAAPTTVTSAATSITTMSAVLNGAGTPNGEATSGWFRYSATNPGTCNDGFGTRVPAASGTDLGTGNVAVAYSITSTGLTSGVTYYFCSIVSNASGTAFGTVLSFTIPGTPVPTTNSASSIAATTATLQGSTNPVAAATTAWFRYHTTNPGSCNDSFGTRAPGAGGASLGSGLASVDHSQAISGLTPNTTYYYCAIANNAHGTAFGAIVAFTTLPALPAVSTGAATSITGATATLNGSANPGGAATTGWYRYSTVSPGSCNDSFGTRAPGAGGSSLGSGNSFTAFAQPITGLTPGTLYYYCAIASNTVGTEYGSLLTLTTPAPPGVTTAAATGVTATGATLNGQGDPNLAATTGYFRYSTINPGSCDDSFGSRAPVSSGSSLGSGTNNVPYTQPVSGLSSNTTYYYCAIASNAEGVSFGVVMSLTTLAAPTVTTEAATSLLSSQAVLNGTVDPNGATATGWFRYSTVSPGSCNDSFGTRQPFGSGGTAMGAGTAAAPYAMTIYGLNPNVTYYYCAIASNAYGTAFGTVMSFTTPAALPYTSTGAATSVTGTTATLNGASNPGGAATTGWFRYSTVSPGSCNDSFGTRAPAAAGSSIGSGTSSVAFMQPITGLAPGTMYYFCAIATNSVGTEYGSLLTLTTPSPPAATTSAATSVTASSATLNGQGDPNLATTIGYFRYSAVDPGTCNDSFGSRAPVSSGSSLGSGTNNVPYSQSVSGLSANTTYYYCAIASNAEGVGFGAVMSFTTLAAPTVTTAAATSLLSSQAVLNGTVDPNGASATGWFRYSTVSPGSCSDSFGTRQPFGSGGTAMGSGTVAAPYAMTIYGLNPNVTYYYCAIASNAYGTALGTVMSFTTPAALPSVSTGSASSVTGTTATLNGSSNPGGAATTGWFRYATVSPGTCNDGFGTRAPAAGGASLGSGTGSVAFMQAITGLVPGTLYYYCAIASNSVGTEYGALGTFTTPSPPLATTAAASGIAATSATLNGQGDPNLAATTGYFRYSAVNPGACDDTFGSRAPAVSGGSSLGSGTANVVYSQPVSGLSANTTYYYCAVARNAEGVGFGAVMSFTTLAPPAVTTEAATSLLSSQALLNGTVDPNGASATGWFRYATTNPGSCNDSFGTRQPFGSGGTAMGAGTAAAPYGMTIYGLNPNVTYYYCAIASNAYGTAFGTVMSFTTPAALPVVQTSSATSVTGTTGILNAYGNPGGAATTGWFRYGTVSPGTCNDSFGTRAPAASGSSLGSGTSSVAFMQAITGLTPGTMYYYCAIAQNSVGTEYGSLFTLTTPSAPAATTAAATSIAATSATLNGQGDPNLATGTGYFRYSTVDPGSCNDSFGSRAPVSSGSSLGSGTTNVAYSQSASGLSPNTTYYYCAIVSNAEGLGFGAVMSFTTLAPPAVTTQTVSSLMSGQATLNGTVDPNGASATGWFRYATTNPGSCNDSFGTRQPFGSGGTAMGTGTVAAPYNMTIYGLNPNVTYYYCAIASNAYGTAFGTVMSFTTPAAAPQAFTGAVTGATGTMATLTGQVNPGGDSSTGWFRYSTSSPGVCNDSFGTRTPAAGGSAVGSGISAVAYMQPISGLTPGTLYYYCAIASNSVGTSLGNVTNFTTPAPPVVTTVAATTVTASTAMLNGSGDPNLAATTAYFRYSTTNPGSCNDVFGSRAPVSGGNNLGTGTSGIAYSQQATGLSSNTTYYYCAIATSSEGMSLGAVMSFTTLAAPNTTTEAVTGLLSGQATLNGTADPNGATATGWFRYGTSNPGTCNDSFGTRLPFGSGGSALGAGTAPVPYNMTAYGLTPNTTYYYCAIASNINGTTFGTVVSFTTPAALPNVSTNSATMLAPVSATLNGSVNPGGDSTTAWFRYATVSPGACNDSFGTRAPMGAGGSAVGSGNSTVSFSQMITGLSPLVTYYYCAIGQNSLGTTFGAIVSFTAPNSPTVSTLAATPITATTATLNGSANPNSNSSIGWFRYSTVDPGACSDSFGTRMPASSGTSLGAGAVPVAYSQPLTGLSAGTTYYFCALASSAIGVTLGQVFSFTTPSAAPTVVTSAASPIALTSATLNGSINPNAAATTAWFRYATSNPGACNDSFGTREPSSGGTDVGAGNTPVPISAPLAGLSTGVTYYYCAIASNAIGLSVGTVMTFNTTAPASVTTNAATPVGSTTATLHGSANPNFSSTTGYFRYSTVDPGTCNDSFGTRAPSSSGAALGSGSTPVSYMQAVSGLSAGTTYYYCAIASNGAGVGLGTVMSFTTSGPPMVTTDDASMVSSATATLNGTANPNLNSTTGWFRYSTSNPGACNDTFGTRSPSSGGTALGAGSSPVAYSQPLSGLALGATYYYCAIASNSSGTRFGTLKTFVTSAAPVVTSVAATNVTGSGATLNGTANPNFSAATGWFRYSATNPGACDDSFGTRAPVAGGTSLGSGSSAVAYNQALSGLTPGTTYYFCAIASNTAGSRFGNVLTFSTPDAPAVSTLAPGALANTSAMLNGSATPNFAATTGWFRYSTSNPGACDDAFGTRAPAASGSPLGSGSSAVPFSQMINGLAPSTTYYYCAIASNAVATSFGPVLSFSTPAQPTVTTDPASAISSAAATLNGSGIPNGQATTAWFRYGTTNPGACDDGFGTRAPAVGISLGSGSIGIAYNEPLSGLSPSTTYYYCAIASNADGTAFGSVQSFSTTGPPSVTTLAASGTTTTATTLNANANPHQVSATGWFRYATSNPGACDDAFGTRLPASGGTALGNGSAGVDYSQALSGLTAGVTYYFCAIASNAAGTSFGSVLSVTTGAVPTVVTDGVSLVSSSGATIAGHANPNGATSTGWFRISSTDPGTCDDSFGTRVPTSSGTALGNGNTDVSYSRNVSGLSAGTTYYYCALASSAGGTAVGSVLTFRTAGAPAVTTTAATAVTATDATLGGLVNPGLATTSGWFRVDTSSPGTCNDSFGVRVPGSGGAALGAGGSDVSYTQAITGLAPGATYYYCAIAQNASGIRFGSVVMFVTLGAPDVTTEPVTDVTAGDAALQGTANPNGSETTVWFRYSVADPGACDDNFGVRLPASGGSSVGAGTTAVTFSEDATGLTAATTYYVCAIASSAAGTRFGALVSFTTEPGAPSVTTTAPTEVTIDGALLNGAAIPNGADTTGWFRYDTVDPGTCDDSFGTRVPGADGTPLGAGTSSTAFWESLSGLEAGTQYYYCAIAANSAGTVFGEVLTFTPGATPPSVVTGPASNVGTTTATLSGDANPNGTPATAWFRLGDVDPGTCDDAFGTRVPEPPQDIGGGSAAVPITAALTALDPNRTYFYCAAAGNAGGASFGAVQSFTTILAPPVVTTLAATLTMGTIALSGVANPNGSETRAWFRYTFDDANPGTCSDSFGGRAPLNTDIPLGAGRENFPFSQVIPSPEAGTRLWACAIAENAAGKSFGLVFSVVVPDAGDGKAGDDGCGCRTVGGTSTSSPVGLLLVVMLAMWRLRRRVTAPPQR